MSGIDEVAKVADYVASSFVRWQFERFASKLKDAATKVQDSLVRILRAAFYSESTNDHRSNTNDVLFTRLV